MCKIMHIVMAQNILAISKMVKGMARVKMYGQMVHHIKVNGNAIRQMVKGRFII